VILRNREVVAIIVWIINTANLLAILCKKTDTHRLWLPSKFSLPLITQNLLHYTVLHSFNITNHLWCGKYQWGNTYRSGSIATEQHIMHLWVSLITSRSPMWDFVYFTSVCIAAGEETTTKCPWCRCLLRYEEYTWNSNLNHSYTNACSKSLVCKLNVECWMLDGLSTNE
jgi:hypothetical protein